jgi:hypothetical protein
MNAAVTQALADADWDALAPILQEFAHGVMARYRWRGLRVKAAPDGRLTAGEMSPDDFVMQAVQKLAKGVRAYRPELDLEGNLKGVIESDIDNHRKKSDRRGIIDRTATQAAENPADPMESIPDQRGEEDTLHVAEQRSHQRKLLELLTRSVAGDEELSYLLLAYEDGKYKPAEIETATGIPAERVYELKRKFTQHAEKLIRTHPEFSDIRDSVAQLS